MDDLRWTQPHGLTGLVSVGVGCHLVASAVRGDLAPYSCDSSDDNNNNRIIPPLPLLYVAATVLNAVFGYRLASGSTTNAARMFLALTVCYSTTCLNKCLFRQPTKMVDKRDHAALSFLDLFAFFGSVIDQLRENQAKKTRIHDSGGSIHWKKDTFE